VSGDETADGSPLWHLAWTLDRDAAVRSAAAEIVMFRCIGATRRIAGTMMKKGMLGLVLTAVLVGMAYASGVIDGVVAIGVSVFIVWSFVSMLRLLWKNRAPTGKAMPDATANDLRQAALVVSTSGFAEGTHSVELTADRLVWRWHDADHVTTHPRSLVVGVRLVANRVVVMRSPTAWVGMVPFGAFETPEDMARFCEDLGGSLAPTGPQIASTTAA
jgi:hypothetical protein